MRGFRDIALWTDVRPLLDFFGFKAENVGYTEMKLFSVINETIPMNKAEEKSIKLIFEPFKRINGN